MRSMRAVLLFGTSLAAAPALAGPDWIEGGRVGGPDAGSTLGTAQPILATSRQITTIVGSLDSGNAGAGLNLASGPDFEDMFLLQILDPSTFSFHLTSAGFDAQLFLFNVTLPGEAFGLLANNDTAMSTDPFLSRPATDLTGADVRFPGIYALAISGVGRVPVSSTGRIFFFGSPTEVSGPDGVGGLNPHIGWTGVGQTGSYTIEMTGVGRYDVPAPGASILLLGSAGFMGARRRRR